MQGFLNVYKESGMTSHDVVNKVRKIFNTKVVGHTGTLDPNATGVLIVAVGKATKCIEYLEQDSKTYKAELKLGITSDTEDIWGNIINKKEMINISNDDIKNIINGFIGKQKQVPPMYSAIKIKGQKLYDLARKGIEVEREARPIEIYNINDILIKEDNISFEVDCSKGTYIRTLCSSIGEKIGCGAVMSSLERIRVGDFFIKDSHKLSEIEEKKENFFVNPEYALKKFPIIYLNDVDGKRYSNGIKINSNNNEGIYRIYINDSLYGIGQVKNGLITSIKKIEL